MARDQSEQQHTGFEVDGWTHVLSGLMNRHRRALVRLGNLESRLLDEALQGVTIRQPVYIAGLARSGTTTLLEMLAWHDQVATHRYRDFPLLHLPYAWNRFLDLAPRRQCGPEERAHGDGILVTPESPEAFEEVLWMTFFPQLHDPAHSAVLDRHADAPGFEAFYRAHIRKLLLLRGARRYVSKGNYNVTRLGYLLKIFPDARFLIPVRDPVWHIASLIKQHRLFCRAQANNPRAVTHLQRAGHFEFGVDRRPINVGNNERTAEIRAHWAAGNEVEGWALYWAEIHGFLADCLDRDPALRHASRIVPFETLCSDPAGTLWLTLTHCGLPADESLLQRARRHVRFPAYYRPTFDERELETIHRLTADAAARIGAAPATERVCVAPRQSHDISLF